MNSTRMNGRSSLLPSGQALDALDNFRTQEGLSLYNDIIFNINTITTLLEQIAPFELERTAKSEGANTGRIKRTLFARRCRSQPT